MGAKKDLKTLFFRVFLVVVYCLVGAGIFYAMEHTDNYEEEVNRKQQLLNKTKREIMHRFGINDTEFDSLVMKVIDAKSDTPLQWTFTRGIDLCWQTITTVGKYTRNMLYYVITNVNVNIVISLTVDTFTLCDRTLDN